MNRQVRIMLIALLILNGAVACDSDGGSDPPTGAPSAPSSPTGMSTAERDALGAYRGMWDAWVGAGKVSDPDAPALRTYTSGEALKLIVGVLATNRHNQHVTLGNVAIKPTVSEIKPQNAPTEVIIRDCVNTEKWLNHKASGGLVNDIPGGRRDMTATATRTDGTWKIAAFQLGRLGTC